MEPDSPAHDRDRERIRARRLEKLRFWRSACAADSPVVTAHNDGLRAPRLFFFHGDWDNGGLYMARLTAELGLPVVGLAPHRDPVPATIRAMALDRLPHILAAQPQGPYRIGGFCNGALVAYETAHLLLEQGRQVETVLLVAPPSFNATPTYRRLLAALERLFGAARPDAPAARRRRVATLMLRLSAVRRLLSYSLPEFRRVVDRKRRLHAAIRARLAVRTPRAPADLVAERAIIRHHRRLRAAYEEAIHTYAPRPLSARVVVFCTGLDRQGCPAEGYDIAYDGRAWDALCPRAEYLTVPGDHYTCIADHAPALASAMARGLGPPDAISGTESDLAEGEFRPNRAGRTDSDRVPVPRPGLRGFGRGLGRSAVRSGRRGPAPLSGARWFPIPTAPGLLEQATPEPHPVPVSEASVPSLSLAALFDAERTPAPATGASKGEAR